MPLPDASSSAIECSRAAASSRETVVFSFSSTRSIPAPIRSSGRACRLGLRVTSSGSDDPLHEHDPVERPTVGRSQHGGGDCHGQTLAVLALVALLHAVAGDLAV